MKRAVQVGSLIEALLRSRGMDAKVREYHTWRIWDETVGPQIASQARPIRIRDGVLEVRVSQPVWMQQLQLLKPKILTRLNERLDDAELRDIFLRRGRIEPAGGGEAPAVKRPPLPELSPREEEAVASTLATLDDDELKASLGRVLRRQLQLEKSRRGDQSEDSP